MLSAAWEDGQAAGPLVEDLSPQKTRESLRSQPQWKRFLQFIVPTEHDIISRVPVDPPMSTRVPLGRGLLLIR